MGIYSIRTRPKDIQTTTGTRDMEQLLTLRGEVSREIRSQITERCAAYDILLDDVAITHLTFSKDYATAIERKQIAEQEAQRQAFNVAKAEHEKLATIKLAEGEADAAEKMSRAFAKHGTGMLEVKRILAAREIAETLASANNVMYLPGGGQSPTVLL